MHMCIDYAENRVRYRYLTKAWGAGGPPLRPDWIVTTFDIVGRNPIGKSRLFCC
jgi:hypothetical protein